MHVIFLGKGWEFLAMVDFHLIASIFFDEEIELW